MDEEIVWLARSKRRGARLLLALGLVLVVGGGLWLHALRDYRQTVSIPSYDMGDGTRSPALEIHKRLDPRILAGSAVVIGAALAIAGGVLLARVRRITGGSQA
ncbi:MAG TPA: hypothetical protein VFK02_03415 [Kofleriaceae bacterium]|nr:hypothetical protein [Kofleriaceae bacterium]